MLDLGDNTLRLAVATCDDEGLTSLIALVERPSQGVSCGKIENIALVCQTINELLDEMEQEYSLRVESLYAGISGTFIRSARHSDHVYVSAPHSGVTAQDVEALADRMANVQSPDGEIIMERFAQNYMVDGVTEVKNPVGSFGRKLSSIYNFILCQQTPAKRVELALDNCGVKLLSNHSNALAISDAIATDEERREGVVIVDVGGQLTDIAICQHNVVRYIASVPLGANAINADIKYMMIPEQYIERLKCNYGNAVSDLTDKNRAVKVPGRTVREDKRILLRNLSMVIEARALDIAEFVRSEIREAGYEGRISYLVLTGGSAKLTNFDELLHRTTGLDVRVGYPINGFDDMSQMKIALPDYSALAGLLIKSASLEPCSVVELATQMDDSALELIEEPLEEFDSVLHQDEEVADREESIPSGELPLRRELPTEDNRLPREQELNLPILPNQDKPVVKQQKESEVEPPVVTKPSDSEVNQEQPKQSEDMPQPESQDYYDEEDDDNQEPQKGIKGLFGRLANTINKSFGGEDNEDI